MRCSESASNGNYQCWKHFCPHFFWRNKFKGSNGKLFNFTKEITEKIRVKLITFLLFFLTFRPQIDISKILLIVTFFCVSFITWLTFKRSNFLIATRTSTFLQHLKILFLYCLVGVINYVMYSTIYILVEKSLSTNKKKSLDMVAESMDFLIYYLLSLEVYSISYSSS